ncbi:MAG: radical SAM protein [Thermoproteus sp. AZ2]|uniref:Radical SAM protein n=1 Tax=Thermoproteus sp. AZ2 TaxID=1609232 RepID=A0ACC6UZV3_9CREN
MIRPFISRLARLLGVVATLRASAFLRRLAEGAADEAQHVEAVRSSGACALYVHMPFCHTPLCSFCCFVRYPYNKRLNARYMVAAKKEVEWLLTSAEDLKISSVYFGGGTPTIDVEGLAGLVDLVRGHLGGGVEVAVEANPRDIDDKAVEALRSVGVARLSIGAQSLDGRRLVKLGRLNHTVADTLRAVEAARGKFKTVNLDILWGAPGDDLKAVREEAARALSLGVDQVTFYPLMPPAPPRLGEDISRGGPWHPEEPSLYAAILGEALSRGYNPATPWCMEKSKGLIDEYVVECDDFLAAGVSGIGRLNGYVYLNTFNVERYIKLVERRGFSAVRAVRASGLENALYYASTRLFGLSLCLRDLKKFGGPGALLSAALGAALPLIGEGAGGCYRLKTPEALYLMHAAQKGIYMAVNSLRRWGIKAQV